MVVAALDIVAVAGSLPDLRLAPKHPHQALVDVLDAAAQVHDGVGRCRETLELTLRPTLGEEAARRVRIRRHQGLDQADEVVGADAAAHVLYQVLDVLECRRPQRVQVRQQAALEDREQLADVLCL